MSYYLPPNCVCARIYTESFLMWCISGLLKSNDLNNPDKKLKAAIYSKIKSGLSPTYGTVASPGGCPFPVLLTGWLAPSEGT